MTPNEVLVEDTLLKTNDIWSELLLQTLRAIQVDKPVSYERLMRLLAACLRDGMTISQIAFAGFMFGTLTETMSRTTEFFNMPLDEELDNEYKSTKTAQI